MFSLLGLCLTLVLSRGPNQTKVLLGYSVVQQTFSDRYFKAFRPKVDTIIVLQQPA